tara:strand:- start:1259 stop:1942 length:684 start_codon:yes stop_codon:yes gene_type:complete
MICRKDTLGYVDFMRGKYTLNTIKYLRNIINEMTIIEKNNLLTCSFESLWNSLWGEYINNQYRCEKNSALEKFKILKSGFIVNNHFYSLKTLIQESTTSWDEPEWGFPKGRRNYLENDLRCAIREHEEETGVSRAHIRIINNIVPFEETFIGSNYKSYKHSYFIAKLLNNRYREGPQRHYQMSEVSKVEWKTYEEAVSCIRSYNIERINILNNINKMLANYEISEIS